MQITEVNPAAVRGGNKLVTSNPGAPRTTTRTVKRVAWCDSSPEHVHLDHECYDTRFTSVRVAS